LIAGERRWRAAQIAGLERVPVVIRNVPDENLLEIALIENIQREDLNPIEEAIAYKRLIESVGLSQDALAARVFDYPMTFRNLLKRDGFLQVTRGRWCR
jgi:ParB family transcriptional regulator, chromosome partitioning protein